MNGRPRKRSVFPEGALGGAIVETMRSRNGAIAEHVLVPKTAATGIETPLPKQGEVRRDNERLGGRHARDERDRNSGGRIVGSYEYSQVKGIEAPLRKQGGVFPDPKRQGR